MPAENGLVSKGPWNIRLNFLASEFFGNQRDCRFYTVGCVNKMAVSVTGPRAVNELGGLVIRGNRFYDLMSPKKKKIKNNVSTHDHHKRDQK